MAITEKLIKLVDQLVPLPHPKIESDLELIVSAYVCAAIEQIISMRQLASYHQLDPVILQQIKDELKSAR